MKNEVLAQRYAEALADLAEPTAKLPQVRTELLALAGCLKTDRAFNVLVSTSARRRDEKKAFFRRLGAQVGLSVHTGRLLEYLVEKRRTALLPQIADAFARETDRRLGLVSAQLVSAAPLTDEQQGRIKARLEQVTNKKVRLEQQLDESLIAGFQVKLDGKFFDGSLRGQLESIRERIAHGA